MDGQAAASTRVYPDEASSGIFLFAENTGGVKVLASATVYEMKPSITTL